MAHATVSSILFLGEVSWPSIRLAAPGGTGVTTEALEIPSGEVKFVHPFELAANGITTIELDFDGDQSVRQTGNGRYRMTPVIKILAGKDRRIARLTC
jgi:hypothetical protein